MTDKPDLSSLLTAIPCPAGLWTEDRSLCLLNEPAIALLGFQESDFANASLLWSRQVNAGDREKYASFARRVGNREAPQTCDYRFSPKGQARLIWLREFSAPIGTDAQGYRWKIISTYMEISEFQTQSLNASDAKLDDIIDELFHDAQNSVHRVGMELELVKMGLGSGSDPAQVTEMIKLLENSVRDLRGYISSMQGPWPGCDPAAVLDGVVTNWQMVSGRKDVNVIWVPPQSVSLVPVHRKLLSRVLERIFEFCESLMQRGGELRIVAALQESAGQIHAEISLTLLAAVPIPIAADQEFFGRPSDQSRAGRGITRALEILRRHHGEVSFRKVNDYQCVITIRLRAQPL